MKSIIIGMTVVFTMTLGCVILFTIQGENSRQVQLDRITSSALSDAVRTQLEVRDYELVRPIDRSDYKIRQQQIEEEFRTALLEGITGEGETSICFLANDWERGLFSVKVTRQFRHPNGNKGEISSEKTIILDYT